MEIVDIVKTKLTNMKVDYESLGKDTKNRLVCIERIIQAKEKEKEAAIDALKNCHISVASATKEIGGSRTTYYKHEGVLKRYIDKSEDLLCLGNPMEDIAKLQAEKRSLRKMVDLMATRDIQVERQQSEIEILTQQLAESRSEIERLRERNSKLAMELQRLDNKEKKSGGVVGKFKIQK